MALFTSSIEYMAFFSSIIQMILYLLFLSWLFRFAIRKNIGFKYGMFSGLFSLLLLSKGWLGLQSLNAILLTNFHFGSTLVLLILVPLFLSILKAPNIKKYIIFVVLFLISCFSDKLLILYFSLPMALCLGIYWLKRELSFSRFMNFIVLMFIMSIVCNIGIYYLGHNVTVNDTNYIQRIIDFPHFFVKFISNIKFFFESNIIILILWVFF